MLIFSSVVLRNRRPYHEGWRELQRNKKHELCPFYRRQNSLAKAKLTHEWFLFRSNTRGTQCLLSYLLHVLSLYTLEDVSLYFHIKADHRGSQILNPEQSYILSSNTELYAMVLFTEADRSFNQPLQINWYTA